MLKRLSKILRVPLLHRLAQFLTLAIYMGIFMLLVRGAIAIQKAAA